MSNSPSTPDLPPPPEYVFREHKATVNHVHIFDRDQHFASCDAEGWVVVWKMKTRRPISKWKAHKESCLKVTTIENHTLISQGRDNMIHIWKSCLNEPELVSSVVYNALGFCKFSCYSQDNDSTLLCFPSKDDIAMFDIYDLTYQKYVLQNVGGNTDIGSARQGACMALQLFRTLDALFIVAGYESGQVALWQIKQDKSSLIWYKQEHQEPILDLSIDSNRAFLISSSADNQICKYMLGTGDVIKKIKIKKSGVVALKIRSDNKIFASGGYDGKIRVFSVKSMKPLAVLSYHKNTTYGLDFGAENNWLVSASQDYRISLWSIF